MKKFIASIAVIVSFAFYSILHSQANNPTVIPVTTPTSQSPQSSDSSSSGGDSASSPTISPSTATSSTYKDGVYTGAAADAFYGNIQVRATIQNGKLTDVVFLQYPNDHHESIEINSQAMPLLKQEAISAQSANVDGVTRATDTSMAFRESLSSALSQAKS